METERFIIRENRTKFYLLIMIDVFSRWVQIGILKGINTKSVIKTLKRKWFDKYDKPNKILSDQGRQFISNEFLDFLKK